VVLKARAAEKSLPLISKEPPWAGNETFRGGIKLNFYGSAMW